MNQTKMVLKANSFLLVIGMTNPEQDTRQAVKECTVTQVHGQPTNQDINRLEDELIAITSIFILSWKEDCTTTQVW
jgi:phosphoribosylanthranilate isomerase